MLSYCAENLVIAYCGHPKWKHREADYSRDGVINVKVVQVIKTKRFSREKYESVSSCKVRDRRYDSQCPRCNDTPQSIFRAEVFRIICYSNNSNVSVDGCECDCQQRRDTKHRASIAMILTDGLPKYKVARYQRDQGQRHFQ